MELPESVKNCVKFLYDKKGEDILILDMRELIPEITDYFIIVTGHTHDHILSMEEYVEGEFAKRGLLPHHIEGHRHSRWILMDYGFFIVHIMLKEAREFYSLEELWGDAPRVRYDGEFKEEN